MSVWGVSRTALLELRLREEPRGICVSGTTSQSRVLAMVERVPASRQQHVMCQLPRPTKGEMLTFGEHCRLASPWPPLG